MSASRRSTRAGGTWRSCASAGKAKPSNSNKPVNTPCKAGMADGAGKLVSIKEPSSITSTWCTAKPSRQPAADENRPTRANSSVSMREICDCTAPRQRMTAMPSRCRVM
ncbi:hypothetical protein D3C71_1134910 [compost metagenome]